MTQKNRLTLILTIGVAAVGVAVWQVIDHAVPATLDDPSPAISLAPTTSALNASDLRIQQKIAATINQARQKLQTSLDSQQTVIDNARDQVSEEQLQKLNATADEMSARLKSIYTRKLLKTLMNGVRFAVEQDDALITAQSTTSSLSWRVHMLPLIGQRQLYDRFRKDEPWDSDHNRSLLPEMPELYRHIDDAPDSTKTRIQAVTGPGYFGFQQGFHGAAAITDSVKETAALIVVAETLAVPWTAAEDIEFSEAKFSDLMQQLPSPKFIVSTIEGAALLIDRDVPYEAFHQAATIAGGETDVLGQLLNP